VWTGGLIVLTFLVLAIRKATDDIDVLRATARMFSKVSWSAFGIAVIAGTWLYTESGLPWSQFTTKGTLVVGVGVLTLVHQVTAKRSSPAVRGIVQLVIVLLSIGIFGAAVALVPGP